MNFTILIVFLSSIKVNIILFSMTLISGRSTILIYCECTAEPIGPYRLKRKEKIIKSESQLIISIRHCSWMYFLVSSSIFFRMLVFLYLPVLPRHSSFTEKKNYPPRLRKSCCVVLVEVNPFSTDLLKFSVL